VSVDATFYVDDDVSGAEPSAFPSMTGSTRAGLDGCSLRARPQTQWSTGRAVAPQPHRTKRQHCGSAGLQRFPRVIARSLSCAVSAEILSSWEGKASS